MDTLVWVGQLILALMILVTLHEFGHFAPAKWFKARVDKFIIFFDPWITPISKKIGETEYGFGWLPLGGYVKIAGMIDESQDTKHLKEAPQPWEFRSKTAWQRFVIMIGGIFMNVILSFIIFAGVLAYFGKEHIDATSIKHGLQMDSTLLDVGFQNGDMITKVGNKPFDKLDQGMFMEEVILRDARTVDVVRNGEPKTLSMPTDLAKRLTGGKKIAKNSLFMPRTYFEIDEVTNGSPAEKAQMKKGDRIIAINNQPVEYFQDFSPLAEPLKGQTTTVSVLRNSDTLQLPITLTAEGKMGVMHDQMSRLNRVSTKYTLAEAIPGGIAWSWSFLQGQFDAFGQMFKGKIAAKDNVGSVISIGKMFGTTWNWERFWILTGSLSMLLAFMNLLPIPGLDGGYILFLLFEMVTGKRVSDEFMIKAVNVGFVLLMTLMVLALGNDIWRHFIR